MAKVQARPGRTREGYMWVPVYNDAQECIGYAEVSTESFRDKVIKAATVAHQLNNL